MFSPSTYIVNSESFAKIPLFNFVGSIAVMLVITALSPSLIISDVFRLTPNVNITTNGTLLYEKRNILINSSALRQINISLHSINENANMNSTYLNNVFEAVKNIFHIDCGI